MQQPSKSAAGLDDSIVPTGAFHHAQNRPVGRVKKCKDPKEVSGSEQREHGCFAQRRRHSDAEAATFDEVQDVPDISRVGVPA
jgi:hypothetical protein